MIQLVRNGYIGKLQRIDLWCRDVSNDVSQYHVKPYGSAVVVPVPADLNFDAWQGPAPLFPYTVDRATCWGGYHCPETSLGFIAGCGIHELGLAQWGNKSDHTSPIRYAGTGRVSQEGIFRTLERRFPTGLPHKKAVLRGGRPGALTRRPDLVHNENGFARVWGCHAGSGRAECTVPWAGIC